MKNYLIAFVLFSVTTTFGQTVDSVSVDSITESQMQLVRETYWAEIKPIGWVTDFEKLFTPAEVLSIDSMLSVYEQETTNEIALVTLDTNYVTKAYFDEMALVLAQKWQVGKKNKDNGILIAISRIHRRIRICNGMSIQKVLTDDETKTIIDKTIIPFFIDGNYFEGTVKGIQRIMQELKQENK
ncbi:MAG: TPM domain-containing protein [Bacteroidetes bacterium]|nr:TPM domain-containing protein [Bacteroidota bacterium]